MAVSPTSACTLACPRLLLVLLQKRSPCHLQETYCATTIVPHPLHFIYPMSHAAQSSDMVPSLYSMLFCDKFDISSPRRHLSQDRMNSRSIEQEVKRRCIALHIIRRGDVWDPNLTEALATVYVMLLEDDERNWEQVACAGLPTFIPTFMRKRLLEGATDNHGWPIENEVNTLAIALFWLICSKGKCGLVLLPVQGYTLILYRSPRSRKRRIQKGGYGMSRSVRSCGLSGMCIPFLSI